MALSRYGKTGCQSLGHNLAIKFFRGILGKIPGTFAALCSVSKGFTRAMKKHCLLRQVLERLEEENENDEQTSQETQGVYIHDQHPR
jgi:hypothetical protein